MLIWLYAPLAIGGMAPTDIIYEIVPGFIVSSLVIRLVARFDKSARPRSAKALTKCLPPTASVPPRVLWSRRTV